MVTLKRVETSGIITESKQVGTLYHVCTLDAVSRYIAPNDTLSSSGVFFNQMLKRTDCVSFTRDKNFIVDTPRNRKALMFFRFVVDGNKLSNHYKVVPYNDSFYDPDSDKMVHYPSKDREKEEIVVGKIHPFSDYVLKVEFSLSKDVEELNKKNLNSFLEEFNLSYSYLSQFSVVYNRNLSLDKGNTESLSSLEECKDFLESLIK